MPVTVAIIVGSTADLEVMSECEQYLDYFGISHETRVSSAHRQPDETASFARGAREAGFKVLIAAAGMAAHLPGVLAALTTLPVIGVPLVASALGGVDALYSIVQMPAGIPVATMAIGTAGARNAAVLAAEILAVSDPALADALLQFRLNNSKI
jgi:5-(carboxyamino)imidazole ribonucleotide mutase